MTTFMEDQRKIQYKKPTSKENRLNVISNLVMGQLLNEDLMPDTHRPIMKRAKVTANRDIYMMTLERRKDKETKDKTRLEK